MIKLIKTCYILMLLCSSGVALGIEAEKPDTNLNAAPSATYGLNKRIKILGALCLIFAPIGLYSYGKNKKSGRVSTSQINVLEKKALDQSSALILVESMGTVLLLSKTGTQVSLIKEYKKEDTKRDFNTHESDPYNNLSLIANA